MTITKDSINVPLNIYMTIFREENSQHAPETSNSDVDIQSLVESLASNKKKIPKVAISL